MYSEISYTVQYYLDKRGEGGGGAPPEWGLFAKRDIGNQGNKGFPGVPANPVEGNRIGPTDNLGQSLESILQNTLGLNAFFATPILLHTVYIITHLRCQTDFISNSDCYIK